MSRDLVISVESLQNLLIGVACGGTATDSDYKELRTYLLDNGLKDYLPKFVLTNRSVNQFWHFIKHQYGTYSERRNFIYESFSKAFSYLERPITPGQESATNKIKEVNFSFVHAEWNKALARKTHDPEGAITSSRTLIETVCKYILDSSNVSYSDDLELPKLYKLTAAQLNLSPDQHTEQIFKQILGGCQTVVEGLGGLRNKLSDAHGRGIKQTKPAARHAELAVNLAGSMAQFLIETFDCKHNAEATPNV